MMKNKGCKKKRLPPQKWLLLSQFLHNIHHRSPEAEFYQVFRSYFKIFVRLVVFGFMMKNAPKGRIFKLPGKEFSFSIIVYDILYIS